MQEPLFFDRDISWLTFNARVLSEAASEEVPLLERIKFLSIYSSNLDEFYRVRIPYLQKLEAAGKNQRILAEATEIINQQQDHYGQILKKTILPELQNHGFHFCYHEVLPESILPFVNTYFYTHIAGFLQPVKLKDNTRFFPENNQLYLVAITQFPSGERTYLINVPSNDLKRFVRIDADGFAYIVFLEDIIRCNLQNLFPGATNIAAFNIKVTRDAELNVLDENDDEILTEKFEKQLKSRDMGFATRFLYEPGMPTRHLQYITSILNLQKAALVEGGWYHNLKDLASLPVHVPSLTYPDWPAVKQVDTLNPNTTLFDTISEKDRIVHAPYQSYDTILRFFNEAAIDKSVTEVYTTMYRVASDSRIAHALISAAKNGKKVTVLVELKARFDEANNIHWAKKMKSAGVKIIHSVSTLKVHAKLALVKRKNAKSALLGLLATGNLNESTARFYTDHILLTAHQEMLEEAENLFGFLSKKKKPENTDHLVFRHLLVAQFNLQNRFLQLIDREIENSRKGLPSGITIKLNNLEEEVLIKKLYEASHAGVGINLIVRSICRIVPGVPGLSENITVRRIVDRYLEHGRVFIFHNNGKQEVFMGSADWMNRNIYRRIEVCFPVYDEEIKKQMVSILALQWEDTAKAVRIDRDLKNIPMNRNEKDTRSQEAIYRLLMASAEDIEKELTAQVL
ncbi:Polyphosphate kinase [Dyadobacter sp. CECT 9275]|uniref:Polyphosphate kinase n=1 Tax=Dyadobacter helix TaxID=2822344 RepID=A0A916NB19_9BACT|nr:polyphosphate kinase 1 [Dyadobacter sp. CECT 9275]CAG4994167.1 Polyphosphate kinase [Dyadobacter sp. CECT 9275]